MKQLKRSLFSILFLTFLFSSCNTTKKLAYTPAGTWEYVVKNTPMGDMKGSFVLNKDGDNVSGHFITNEGKGEIKDLTLTDNNMECSFSTMGYSVRMKGLFEGESFTGMVMAEGYDFPITATRKQ